MISHKEIIDIVGKLHDNGGKLHDNGGKLHDNGGKLHDNDVLGAIDTLDEHIKSAHKNHTKKITKFDMSLFTKKLIII